MKMRGRVVIFAAGLFSLGLFLLDGAVMAVQNHQIHQRPFYAGFEEIDSGKNHFVLLGDTQQTSHWEFWRERNGKQRKLIIDEITKREPAFVVHLGDLTARGSSKKHWQEFDDRHKEFREKKIPYFPILGNHEFYGDDTRALENYFGRFPHLDQRRWYSFTWKNVGWVMVDSNVSDLTREQIEQQSRWFLGELEKFEMSAEIDFIIVCCHEPPFTNSTVVRPNKQTRITFADPFLQFQKTQLFLSGHSHSYERFQKEGKFFIVSGGGGGPRHKVYTDPRRQRVPDLFSGPELRFFHFCEIEAHPNALVFRVLRLEPDERFSVADSFIMPKMRR